MTAELAEMYQEHSAWLLAQALRLVPNRQDAEDLVQATYLVAASAPFNGDHPRAWLFTLLDGRVRNFRRRQICTIPVGLAPRGSRDVARFPDPEGMAVANDTVERCLKVLGPCTRQAIWLVDVRGLSMAAAARAVGANVPTMQMRVSRGRLRLRHCITL
jgi:RNA polymerase sigma factor (sigma-70 family)